MRRWSLMKTTLAVLPCKRMRNKQEIFDYIEEISPYELARAIKLGVVSYEELCDRRNTFGGFESKAEEVRRILAAIEESGIIVQEADQPAASPDASREVPSPVEDEDLEWRTTDKADRTALASFLDKYPVGKYSVEARKAINSLIRNAPKPFSEVVRQIAAIPADMNVTDPNAAVTALLAGLLAKHSITEEDILSQLREDRNFLNSSVVSALADQGLFRVDRLREAGISDEFVELMLAGKSSGQLPMPERKVEKVSMEPCTEVYFWGIPSSGKSCALGAIMSVADDCRGIKSVRRQKCQGGAYMDALGMMFKEDRVGVLPPGTSIWATYEMGMDIQDMSGNYHPVTFIDMAGEIVRCMYKKYKGLPLDNESEECLGTLDGILLGEAGTRNRKLHFFVIEYGAEERLYEGLDQRTYLEGAAAYIRDNDIFKDRTDLVCILITKADKARKDARKNGVKVREQILDYLAQNYKGFYSSLKEICLRHEIGRGELKVIPFTIGEVCFQNYCRFNGDKADEVLQTILGHSASFSENKLSKIRSMLSK